MKFKILTANIAFGRTKMNNLFLNVTTHFIFHGRQMITIFTNPKALKMRPGYLHSRRVNYLKKYSNLKNVLTLIDEEKADVVMLNELIFQLHRDQLENALLGMGYKYFSWGMSEHYDDTKVSSFVASKIPGKAEIIEFPQESHAGGGGGIAVTRFSELKVTAVAVHMCVSDKFPWLYKAEVEAIAKFILEERFSGREVIICGDFNASSSFIKKYSAFSKLNLKNADNDMPTCPTFFPIMKPLDHIFIPQHWNILNAKTIAFDSDHLAVSVIAELD